MQATINVSLDVPQTKARKHYAHDAICGIMKTNSTDEELLEGYLKDKYGI